MDIKAEHELMKVTDLHGDIHYLYLRFLVTKASALFCDGKKVIAGVPRSGKG